MRSLFVLLSSVRKQSGAWTMSKGASRAHDHLYDVHSGEPHRYPLKDDPLWTLPTQSDWLTTVQQVNKHCSNEPLNRLFEKPTADYSEEEIDVYLDYAEDFLENPRERPQCPSCASSSAFTDKGIMSNSL